MEIHKWGSVSPREIPTDTSPNHRILDTLYLTQNYKISSFIWVTKKIFLFQVVDSRARTGADGSLQAQASRQLEVFQSRAAGARLQVVKTKTVSSSRWSGKGEVPSIQALGFEDLQVRISAHSIHNSFYYICYYCIT